MKPAMIIGLSGKMQAGKNTTYMLAKLLLDADETGVVQKVAFADSLKDMAQRVFGWDGKKDERGRKLLQDLGVSKREVYENYWVDKTIAQILRLDKTGIPNIIFVTDARFINEAEAIHRLGGVVWRVNRPSLVHTDTHISETALDNYKFDYVIEADSLDELFNAVKDGLALLGLYVPKHQ
jgi:hypothetical protein